MKQENFLAESVRNLPQSPGIYKYLDNNGKIIYVGKAKNLKKRVSSYFVKNHSSYKTNILVKNIRKIEYIVVETESDALLLENTLIKELQPKYNVLLKDDKTYPWLCIKNENFPRVFYTRKKIHDGSEYFGPFTSVYMIKTLISLIRQLYPLRTCSLNLSYENIKSERYKVCLEYHLGNCLAPCLARIDETQYNSWISDIRKIFNGDLHLIQQYLTELMKKHAQELKFEKASEIKNKIDIIENYKSKTTIVDTNISNTEVYGFDKDLNSAYINYLRIQNGSVIGAHSIELKKKIDESDEDLLSFAIVELRELTQSSAKNIILPFKIEYQIFNTQITYPQKGDKHKLLLLAQRNAHFFMLERHKQIENKNPEKHALRKMETLQKDLNLSVLPVHIECFDNSNIQGTNPVAACVVFKNARPSKSDYRHYNIKSVTGPDDFASMTEVVYRRYKRTLDENQTLPQLIIIDGGKGQLSAAMSALKELNISDRINIIGIAKRLEEIYFPGDNIPLYIDKNSESLKLIQQIRDEAHRFGIKFHRDKRSSNFAKSELLNINGIGSKTVEELLTKYKSTAKIKNLSIKEISETTGKKRAKLIFDYFHKKKG